VTIDNRRIGAATLLDSIGSTAVLKASAELAISGATPIDLQISTTLCLP
jgi:hypothetical protein